MAVKVTFTLDEATIERLQQTAERLGKPKSEVVREAIRSYHAQKDRMSEAEREEKVRILRAYAAMPPTGTQAEVDAELAELGAVRRRPGRLHPNN